MRDPLLLPACLFAAGVAFGAAEWITGGSAAGLAFAAALVAGAGRLLSIQWVFWVCGSLALFLLGAANMALRPLPGPPPAVETGRRILEGCVVESLDMGEGRLRVTVMTETASGVQVNAPVVAGRPRYGDTVRGEVDLRPVRNFGIEGAFDRATFLARRGIHWQAAMSAKGRWQVRESTCGHWLARGIHEARRVAGERLATLFGSDRRKQALLRALLLGDGTALRKSWVEDFRRTGTYHALVISGGHITLICGVFLLWHRWVGWGGRSAIVLAAGLAWFYSVVAGGAIPALRAAAAMSLAAIGLLIFRTPRLMNILAAVALIFLLIDPGQLFEASFQLSFLAVACIGLLAQTRPERNPRAPRLGNPWLVEAQLAARTMELALGGKAARWETAILASATAARWAGQTLVVSGAIQLGLLLPMAVYFQRISLTGLVANVVVTPLISMAIPVGFLALVLNSGFLGGLASSLVEAAQWSAIRFAALEPEWPVPAPPVWLAVVFAASLLITVAILRLRRKWAVIPLGASLAGAGLIVAHPFPARQSLSELEITLLDTGQSESLLLGLPEGGFVLVDAGGAPGGPGAERRFDVGEDLIAPYLRRRGIRRLEEMVITHLHEDHSGGAPYLIRSFRPARFRTPYTPDYKGWRKLERELQAAGTIVQTAGEGSEWHWGSVRVKALAPSPEQRWRGKPQNNDSLILMLTYGRRKVLLAGDAERGVSERLAEDGLLEPVDVLKVPHHGAKSALSPALLKKTKPAIALISAGWKNSFGFPHPETLEALRAEGAIPLRTDLKGAVTVRTDGVSLTFETFAESTIR